MGTLTKNSLLLEVDHLHNQHNQANHHLNHYPHNNHHLSHSHHLQHSHQHHQISSPSTSLSSSSSFSSCSSSSPPTLPTNSVYDSKPTTISNTFTSFSANATATHVKLCHVCGDKAIAFNFNGLTCESCKSFFRRNAFKIHKFKCNRENKCRIELYNRKYCQFCRLQKCFDIGMKKELVLDRKRKHERNAALKQVEVIRFVKDIDGDEAITNALLVDLLTKLDEEAGHFKNSTVILDNKEETENDQLPLLDAFSSFTTDQFELNQYEQSIVNEINHASAVFTEELSLQVRGEAKSFKESCNLPALYIRKIIRFCKNVIQFRLLNKEDQLLIIKPYFTEILLIRFAFAYNYEHDAISVIENEIEQNAIWVKIDLLKEANRHSFALVYRKYMFQSKMEMENDVTARNLLATILMFRSRENISCPEFIRYCHIMYKRLLSRYLEAKYQEKSKAEEKFEKLMHVLERACDVTHSYSELYKLLDIKEVTGVLKEIYLN